MDAIIKTRHELEHRLEENSRQLSDLWDDIFEVFLRAICRQFDNEMEVGTDFLRQEARTLVKLFPKTTETMHDSTLSALDNPIPSRTWHSSVMSGPDERVNTGGKASHTKSTFKEGDGDGEYVNPPIGLSDNGWGRKRCRVSSDNPGDDTDYIDCAPHGNLRDTITRMQQQLDEQGEKIKSLIKQNQAVSVSSRYCAQTYFLYLFHVVTAAQYPRIQYQSTDSQE